MQQRSLLFPSLEQKLFIRPEPEPFQHLSRDRQVIIMSGGTIRNSVATASTELLEIQKPEKQSEAGWSPTISSSLLKADEIDSWFQNIPDDVPLPEEEFPYLHDIFPVESVRQLPTAQSKARSQTIPEQYNILCSEEDHVPPTKLQANDTIPGGTVGIDYSNDPIDRPKSQGNVVQGVVRNPSTVGSGLRGRNQIQNVADYSRVPDMLASPAEMVGHKKVPQNEKGNIASSSRSSGRNLTRKSKQSHKRLRRDAVESKCRTEKVAYKSAKAKKLDSRPGTSRRRRDAENHNLSERRRRDRINEKMRELQELLPHSNKSDKASMLDEAIEYMKSLQLQVQLMWRWCGTVPTLYPGVQGLAMTPSALPSVYGHLQMARGSITDPSVAPSCTSVPPTCHPQLVNPINFQQQMQSPNLKLMLDTLTSIQRQWAKM